MSHYSKNIAANASSSTLNLLSVFLFVLAFGIVVLSACQKKSRAETKSDNTTQTDGLLGPKFQNIEPPIAKIPVLSEIAISGFFKYLDKIAQENDSIAPYKLDEYVLLRANPWILDTLISSDYYFQMSMGNFVFDQRKKVVLHAGDTIVIPGALAAATILEKIAKTRIDINIPAFELHILEGDSLVYSMPVRVGKNQKKCLVMAGGHNVDLRTKTGEGKIIRVNRYPIFFDPVTGERFKFTKRDDRKVTYMSQIPWLEPSINGSRYGQMIHPTTNPRTLGRPASNGCIGVSEADGWRVYFYAPVGTKVSIRYDLQAINKQGDTIRYNDIYKLQKPGKDLVAAGFLQGATSGICVCDTMF